MTQPAIAENILGTENINKLIFKFATPTILSMLTVSLYNLVDQIFIGHAVGYLGNAAINVAFPIHSIVMGFALWIGDGTATYIAMNLGAGRREEAGKAVSQSVILLAIISVMTVAFGYIFMEPILYLSGCTAVMLPYATEYTKYILLGMPFLIFACGMNPSIRADGNPRYAMLAMMAGCLLNFILEPIFIFGLNMGLAGSAIGTVISQLFSAILVLAYFPKLKTFKFERKNIRLHGKLPMAVMKLGLSSLTLNCCQIVNVLIINNLLVFYGAMSTLGAEAVFAAMGAAQKVAFISTNVTSGIGIGSQPIIAFNRGALNFDRVRECYSAALKLAVAFTAVVLVLTRIFPTEIMLIFGDNNPGFMTFGIAVLEIWMLTIMLAAFQDVSTSFFQSIGRPFLAMTIPLARRILLILPMSYFFPKYWGVISILWAGPIADVVVFAIILALLRKSFREMRDGSFSKENL
ncbi:hypothetical protein AXX12_00995 [Anaerosporomusa subterranea]|uniref:Multidrug export protein MepA n=1 Tax=Anaerosporomusa subterranea TaxID=1794912 RepID=A0A154BVV3_ANASB|nr:MATE family efflux transporter [Anaerosporomusa subterranea]KYZ78153.1 hypothetical protein AXX12_00995 [Anaerosporomusa subterranea]